MSKPRTKQKNVLFIITDQQRADHVGFMGNDVVRTPNLDGLAARSTVFDNAWVTNPVCMPNRCSIMTGRMPTAHGVIFNDRTLDWGANTFVRRFREAGYQTALIGKSHLQHGMSKNSMVPFRGSGAVSSPYPAGWDQVEDREQYAQGTPQPPADFYGFEHIELSIDHGAVVSGHHLQWALGNGAERADLQVEYSPQAPGQLRSEHWWQIYQPPYAEKFHSTNFVAQRTMSFIAEAAGKDQPWLAFCSFPDPHHPLTPPGKWFMRHSPEDMTLPESRHDDLADAPAHLRAFSRLHPKDQRDWVTPCGFGSDALLRDAIAATYGMVEMVDDRVGQIIETLHRTDAADNTVIIFTSDHGDMMGEHGLLLKGFMHYRGTLQVPMMISVPGVAACRTTSLASSIDLGPTLMEVCEIESFDGIQGLSLAPMLGNAGASVRDYVLIEDDIAPITAKLTPIPAKTRTLITQTHRYTRNSKGEEQLFDLLEDPHEMRDLKALEPAMRSTMVERLTDALMAADDAARGAPTSPAVSSAG